jgi:glycosyltransferase involved in cell wall biosynthesis
MRILHVTDHVSIDGVARHILTLSAAQRLAGDCAFVLLADHGYLATACASAGIPMRVLKSDNATEMLRILREVDPDVVHFHGRVYAIEHFFRVQEAGYATTYTHHSPGFDFFAAGLLIVDNSTPIITVSSKARQGLLDLGFGGEIHWVPNGVHIPAPSGRRLGRRDERLTMVMVGRLSVDKAVDVGLMAMRILLDCLGERCPVLHVFGDGEERQLMLGLRSLLGLTELVTFHGWQPEVIAPDLDVDLLIHPSRHEAFPLVPLEAMSCGWPIVATTAGDVRTMLPSAAEASLVPPNDPAQLAAAIIELLDDEERRKRMGRAAAERHHAHYQPSTMAESIRKVYELVRERS